MVCITVQFHNDHSNAPTVLEMPIITIMHQIDFSAGRSGYPLGRTSYKLRSSDQLHSLQGTSGWSTGETSAGHARHDLRTAVSIVRKAADCIDSGLLTCKCSHALLCFAGTGESYTLVLLILSE